MAWKLIVVPRARRDLEALPERARLSIIHALDDLLANPGQADLAKLSGRDRQWRLRVRRWRVILELRANEGVIYALRVLARRDVRIDNRHSKGCPWYATHIVQNLGQRSFRVVPRSQLYDGYLWRRKLSGKGGRLNRSRTWTPKAGPVYFEGNSGEPLAGGRYRRRWPKTVTRRWGERPPTFSSARHVQPSEPANVN